MTTLGKEISLEEIRRMLRARAQEYDTGSVTAAIEQAAAAWGVSFQYAYRVFSGTHKHSSPTDSMLADIGVAKIETPIVYRIIIVGEKDHDHTQNRKTDA